jgi:hypothetical protein
MCVRNVWLSVQPLERAQQRNHNCELIFGRTQGRKHHTVDANPHCAFFSSMVGPALVAVGDTVACTPNFASVCPSCFTPSFLT